MKDVIPKSCDWYAFGSAFTPFDCHQFVNETWSSPDVEPNNRLYDRVYTLTNGKGFSFHQDHWACFGEEKSILDPNIDFYVRSF